MSNHELLSKSDVFLFSEEVKDDKQDKQDKPEPEWSTQDRIYQVKHLKKTLEYSYQEACTEMQTFGLTIKAFSNFNKIIMLCEEWAQKVEDLHDIAVYLVEMKAAAQAHVQIDPEQALIQAQKNQKILDYYKSASEYKDEIILKMKEDFELSPKQKKDLLEDLDALISICDKATKYFQEYSEVCKVFLELKKDCEQIKNII